VSAPAASEPTLAAAPSQLVTAVAAAVQTFGIAVAPRLASGQGEPEDQMRGPLEALLTTIGSAQGLTFMPVGESSLSDLKVRPDYAAFVNGAMTGYIEVKAPGKGANPNAWRQTSHDGKQWEKLKALPNVLYTDGVAWGLYRSGEPVAPVVKLTGRIDDLSAPLGVPDDGLARLLLSFLTWTPVAPRSISQLVRTVAPLTRLLRDEVIDTMTREQLAGGGPFTNLARDWRALLFPDATDNAFADGYAQTVTFALLLARNEDIPFEGAAVDQIAKKLGQRHSLMGKALDVLADDTVGALSVTLDTIVRVTSVIDFGRFEHHIADPYLHLYEHFLAEYDSELRRQTGSYYTPAQVVSAMTSLTDKVLRTRLGRVRGFADPDVTVVDPAMGTGTYVLEVLETIARTIAHEEGHGAIPGQLQQAVGRIAGIEKQTGPFAVAELRVAAAMREHGATAPPDGLRLYVADTLDDPYAVQAQLAATMEPIAISRRRANKMKRDEPVLVVLGNPPYRERARGDGGFIEDGAPNTEWVAPPLSAFREPGNGRAEYVLSNLYVYFWRWATWKVFDAHPAERDGVICFITTSGYLKGPGFAGMRRYLREKASEGWIIDCTPEGHQPEVNTRIFGGVQQPIAIAVFVRKADAVQDTPATIRYRAVHGLRQQKFNALLGLELDGADWEACPSDWTAPFLPSGGDVWSECVAAGDLFPWQSPGVKPNRTWVYAPLPGTLRERWTALVTAPDETKSSLFRESRDASLDQRKPGLPGFLHDNITVRAETKPSLEPVQVGYRSFDVQWLIPDDRVLATPRTDLWRVRGDHQMFITELHSEAIRPGPALTFSAHLPDMHYFKGSGGGRALPLYAGADRARPNLAPGLLAHLASVLGAQPSPEDVVSYVAAVTAHPAFTALFAEDLRTPGIRVPLTADPALWTQAVAVGQSLIWLHTRGARLTNVTAARPPGPPKHPNPDRRAKVQVPIPTTPDGVPDEMSYDPTTQTLTIGDGRLSPVSPSVADYEVGGMNVLRKWFGYRRRTRPQSRGSQSPLDDIRPNSWPAQYTTDLLDLLNVLEQVVDLEPNQAQLLEHILSAPRITTADLTAAGILPVPAAARRLSDATADEQPSLLDNPND
jgi:hypothetical protein